VKNEIDKAGVVSGLIELINQPPSETDGQVSSQRKALKLLLTIPGAIWVFTSQRLEHLDELERRGVWGGRALMKELAGLELRKRQHSEDLETIRARMQEIWEHELVPSTPKRHRKERRETCAAVK